MMDVCLWCAVPKQCAPLTIVPDIWQIKSSYRISDKLNKAKTMPGHYGVELHGHWGAGTPAPATPRGHLEARMLLVQLHSLLSLRESAERSHEGRL